MSNHEQPDWQIYLRDGTRKHIALFDDFTKFECILRDRATTTWVLDLPLHAGARMVLPGHGIIVLRNNEPVMSGPVNKISRQNNGGRDVMTIAGVDDTALLSDRIAMPEPLTPSPPYLTFEYDVRRGPASTVMIAYVNVNAGPGAVAARRVTGLRMAADPSTGGFVTGRARYHTLSALLDSLALRGGVVYRVIQEAEGLLEFQVEKRRDRTASVQFSNEIGNLGDFTYTMDAPGANFVVVGGGGEGTARTITQGAASDSISLWSRRIEMFRDRRDTTETVEMQESLNEQLAEVAAKTTLEMNVIDTPQMRWREHYDLSDMVTVVIDGVEIEQPIKEIKVTLDGNGEKVEPVVGTPGGDAGPNAAVARLLSKISTLDGRIANLERL